MERERRSELLLKYKRSLEVDQEATDVLGRLYDLRRPIQHGPLARIGQGAPGPMSEIESAAQSVASHLCNRRARPTCAPVLLDEKWDSLLACTSDLVVVVDAEGIVVYVNRALTGLIGSRDNVIGCSVCDWLVPEHRASLRASIEGVFETGQKTCQTVSFLGIEGVPSRQEARIGPIRQGGQTVAVGIFLSDITERETMEAKLRDSELLLRSIVKSVPKMMDIMDGLVRYGQADQKLKAHDLGLYHEQMIQIGRLIAVGKAGSSLADRLPQLLTAIRMSVENALARLEGVSGPEGAVRELKAALGAVSSVTRSVEQVRGFGRTAVGRNWVHRVDIGPIVVRVVELLEAQARMANVSIGIGDMGRLPPVRMAEGDAEQLLFVIIESLLRSADRRKHHRITIHGIINDRYLEMWFSGDGCCIRRTSLLDVRDRRAISQPEGVRADDLGIHLANGIVAQAGGRIVGETGTDGRPAFFITLPTADGVGAAVE